MVRWEAKKRAKCILDDEAPVVVWLAAQQDGNWRCMMTRRVAFVRKTIFLLLRSLLGSTRLASRDDYKVIEVF